MLFTAEITITRQKSGFHDFLNVSPLLKVTARAHRCALAVTFLEAWN
jgi:hypothetical protein